MLTTTLAKATQLDARHTIIRTRVFGSTAGANRYVARLVAEAIRERAAAGQKAVFGLATGSTPLGVYRELIRMHTEEGLDFSNVVTFNLDEYYLDVPRPVRHARVLGARRGPQPPHGGTVQSTRAA